MRRNGPELKYNPAAMTRKEALMMLAELQARHATVSRMAEQESSPVKLERYAEELGSICQQLRTLRLQFLDELERRKHA